MTRSICNTDAYNEALRGIAKHLIEAEDIREYLKAKTFLVTGSSGQIGGAVVSLLAAIEQEGQLGIRVLAATRGEDSFEEKLGCLSKSVVSNVQFIASEPFACNQGIDGIVHCAGYGDPAAFVEDPVGVMLSNINGLNNLLQFLFTQSYGRLLFVSSGEVYGQGAAGVASFGEEYCGSIDTASFRSCYPMAKRAGESLCASYLKQFGVDSVIARQCHVYGPGFSQRDSRVTAFFLRCATESEPIVMKSDGAQVRSYMFEIDVASAYVVLLARGICGEAYNVAPEYTVSIRELGDSIAASAGIPLAIEQDARSLSAAGVGGISRSVLDGRKLANLGWHSSFGVDEGTALSVAVLKEVKARLCGA